MASVLILALLHQRHVYLVSLIFQSLGFSFVKSYSLANTSVSFICFALFRFVFPAYAMLMYTYLAKQ